MEAIKIAKVGPSEEPVTRFRYNDWGYTVLGAILEQISGQKLLAFLEDQLYGPLGMTDTSNAQSMHREYR